LVSERNEAIARTILYGKCAGKKSSLDLEFQAGELADLGLVELKIRSEVARIHFRSILSMWPGSNMNSKPREMMVCYTGVSISLRG
jgi:hypothetical protein